MTKIIPFKAYEFHGGTFIPIRQYDTAWSGYRETGAIEFAEVTELHEIDKASYYTEED
jgi:hypothetical protein